MSILLDLTAKPESTRLMLVRFWQARKLVVSLARRDFFSRYRRASLGVLWAIAMPLAQAGVLAVVFTKVARISVPGNAFVFTYAGIAGWSYFSSGVSIASTSIVDGASLASRIYFPRLVLPFVTILSGGYLLVINYAVMFVVAVAVDRHIAFALLLVPVGMVLTFAMTLFVSTVLAALHVYFRDTKYLVQTILMLALYVSPAFYPLSKAPPKLRILAEMNPMTGPIELTRRGLGTADPGWLHTVAISGGWLVVLFVLTLWLFRRFDRLFSDLL